MSLLGGRQGAGVAQLAWYLVVAYVAYRVLSALVSAIGGTLMYLIRRPYFGVLAIIAVVGAAGSWGALSPSGVQEGIGVAAISLFFLAYARMAVGTLG